MGIHVFELPERVNYSVKSTPCEPQFEWVNPLALLSIIMQIALVSDDFIIIIIILVPLSYSGNHCLILKYLWHMYIPQNLRYQSVTISCVVYLCLYLYT